MVAAIRSKLRAAARAQQTDPRREAERMAAERAAEAEAVAQAQARSPQAQARARAVAEAETMLSCAHCGVFFPASEAVQRGGRDYCSPAHADQPAA